MVLHSVWYMTDSNLLATKLVSKSWQVFKKYTTPTSLRNTEKLDSCVVLSARLPGKCSVFAQMKAANRKNVVAKNDLLICAKNDVNSHPVSTYRDCSVARLFSCGISNILGFQLTASARP